MSKEERFINRVVEDLHKQVIISKDENGEKQFHLKFEEDDFVLGEPSSLISILNFHEVESGWYDSIVDWLQYGWSITMEESFKVVSITQERFIREHKELEID